MKVYISCHHPEVANAMATNLVAAGHEVVSVWHGDAKKPNSRDDWAKAAERNLDTIRENTGALVLIASSDHVSGVNRVAGGKFFEAGYALASGVRVITVGGVENGMLHDPGVEHVADAGELIKLLGTV